MIVRNESSSLARCLASAAPLVDRILIGDTGSVDGASALARDFGAQVVFLPWADDFAAARNHLLDRGTCDWILVLDADEMLDLEPWRAALPSLLTGTQSPCQRIVDLGPLLKPGQSGGAVRGEVFPWLLNDLSWTCFSFR